MSQHAEVCYPDHAWHGKVAIELNEPIARDTYRLRFHCPRIARRIVPGQFVMVRIAGASDPLLGRPLALYDTVLDGSGQPVGIEVVYLVVGRMTRRLATLGAGQPLEVWGPLGNGFPATRLEHLVMVAGGIGQTPFLALAKEYLGAKRYGEPERQTASAEQVTFCYGVRSRDYLAGLEDFEPFEIDARLSTDDGSYGHHGLVTDLLRGVLAETNWTPTIVCCGPEKMMEAVAGIAGPRGVQCLLSLETPMACGLGICFSCVVRVRQADGHWDYRRTCVEGPVFDANDVQL